MDQELGETCFSHILLELTFFNFNLILKVLQHSFLTNDSSFKFS